MVYAGCQWAILAVIARLGSPAAVGQFALGLAVNAPVFLLCGLQLRGVQATDATGHHQFADYFGVRIAGVVVAVAVSGATAALTGYDAETAAVVFAVGASKAVEGLCDVHYGFLQNHERMRSTATSLALRGILSVATIAAVMAAGGGLLLAVLALVGSWTAVFLVHDVAAVRAVLRKTGERHAPRFDARTFGRIVVLAGPLGIVMMLISLRTNVPRYFLEHHVGVGDLGIFAALASVVTAGNLVISALGQSASPRLARHLHAGDLAAFRRVLGRLLVMGAVLGAFGVAFAVVLGRPALHLLFGSDYANRADVFVWLMAAGAVGYVGSFLGYAATAARRFRVQLPLFSFTLAIAAAASFWLVPRHGLLGAAWAWGLAVIAEVSAMALVVLQVIRSATQGSVPR
jgi:O-antigen/teichoic acid export membrane protein